jgi:hypothetical protein
MQKRKKRDWRDLPVGAWFFCDSPNCVHRYSVQERTDGGSTLVCSTPWHYAGAKKNMRDIARAHNEAEGWEGERYAKQ